LPSSSSTVQAGASSLSVGWLIATGWRPLFFVVPPSGSLKGLAQR
jgi:hypothetical protein